MAAHSSASLEADARVCHVFMPGYVTCLCRGMSRVYYYVSTLAPKVFLRTHFHVALACESPKQLALNVQYEILRKGGDFLINIKIRSR